MQILSSIIEFSFTASKIVWKCVAEESIRPRCYSVSAAK
jgi:hypothetical protein